MSSEVQQPNENSPLPFAPTAKERARIRHLLKRLPKHCLNNYDFENRFPIDLEINDYYSLLSDLKRKRDKDWGQRAVAAWALGASSNFAVNRLVISEHLREVVKNWLQTKPKLISERLATAAFRTFVPCYFLFATLITFTATMRTDNSGQAYPFWQNLIWGCIVALPVSSIVAAALLSVVLPLTIIDSIYSNDEARIMAVLSLHRQNALEALPELLEGACDKSPEVLKKCRLALTDFLPRITEANRDFMPLNNGELIGKILEDMPDLVLGSAILDYLEKFGTGRNCTAVEFYLKCLMHKANLPAFNEVYAKGQRVFVVLQERRGRNRESEHLLRHSIAPNAHPNELLRPAADSQLTPSEQLLRSSDYHP